VTHWTSTRGAAPPVSFREALFAGLAPDGGLYMPGRLEPLSAATLQALEGRSLVEVGAEIAAHLLGDEIPRDALARGIAEALDFQIPLRPVGESFALELFHGPTFAFKDVGARVMARLMAHFVAPGDSLTVLVATSGDTGSAVAQAFAGVAGTRILVLYPQGQVSDVQEAQFATIGGNVQAVAVAGSFDDCQALVKAAFSDARVREHARLTSANSINVGRLLPQVFYYAWGALHQPHAVWSVPSGNFGNLTAGLIAKRLGFPIAHFIAATNVNDVVPAYLASGIYVPRASVRTVANAMDVGSPSNFERIQTLYDGSLERIRADIRGVAFDDARVTGAIAEVHARHGYVLDPHSAIAWLGLQDRAPQSAIRNPRVFVATAHPAKFRETVEPAVGHAVDLPQALREALTRPRLITRISPRLAELADLLR
jgi:threonine synthase